MPIYGYQGRLGVQDDQIQQYLNQARGQNPIGRLGQISNFAALEQAGQARTAQQRSQVEAAARALEQQSQQESAAAEQRAQVARSQQLQEQQQRLEQERFNQQLALQRKQLEEQKAYRDAQAEENGPYNAYADYRGMNSGFVRDPRSTSDYWTNMGYSPGRAIRAVSKFYDNEIQAAGGRLNNVFKIGSYPGR